MEEGSRLNHEVEMLVANRIPELLESTDQKRFDEIDIDIEVLADYGLTFETYFPEATDLAEFLFFQIIGITQIK